MEVQRKGMFALCDYLLYPHVMRRVYCMVSYSVSGSLLYGSYL